MKKYYILEGKRNMRPNMKRLPDGRHYVEVETDDLLDELPVVERKTFSVVKKKVAQSPEYGMPM